MVAFVARGLGLSCPVLQSGEVNEVNEVNRINMRPGKAGAALARIRAGTGRQSTGIPRRRAR